MGGKSSKNTKKGGGGNSKNGGGNKNNQNDRNNSRSTKEAWQKPIKNGNSGKNSNNKNKLKDANDTWVTTYNLLDLELENARGGGGGGGKFNNFRDITRDRKLEDSERKRQEYNVNRYVNDMKLLLLLLLLLLFLLLMFYCTVQCAPKASHMTHSYTGL